MRDVVGLGAGGHARVVIEVLQNLGGFRIIGLLDPDQKLWGATVLGVPVLGGDGLLSQIRRNGTGCAFIGLGSTGDLHPRSRLYALARSADFEVLRVLHDRAIISPSAEVGTGATILAGAIVNSQTRLGENVLLNTGAIVEHDCKIGNHTHIATGANLAGGVTVGELTHLGIGASVRQGVCIGSNVIIGAGAAVVDDIQDNSIVGGVPARLIRRRIES